MAAVSLRDLRNHGGEIVDRAGAGEPITITRSGMPVAELRPLAAKPMSSAVLLERWRGLPRLNLDALRNDIDAVRERSDQS